MTKRERKYHNKKKPLTIIDMFAKNIQETIDDEIIRILKKAASGEINNQSDLIPFTTNINHEK